MIATQLNDKIDIYAVSSSTNEFSEREKSYSFSFSVRSEIFFQSATERQTGQMINADKTMKFKVRFSMDRFNETQVILWRGDYYNIRGIDPDRHREYLFLIGERVPPGHLTITT